MKDYKGYPLFNDTKERKLQAFNRLQTMANVNDTLGAAAATVYVNHFSDEEKKDLAVMAHWIKTDGIAQVQRQVRGDA